MNYQKAPRLFFDIETLANPENLALMPEPVVTAPANYKDPAKIEEYIKIETEKKKAEMVDKAALDPDYGKILSIGMANGVDGPIVVSAVGDEYPEPIIDPDGNLYDYRPYALTEADLIETFWVNLSEARGNCVGYNILNFDLPYLMRRSMYLGIRIPYLPILAKYRVEPVTDLMMLLCNWDTYKAKGLKQMARLLGIPNDCPDIDGSKVATLPRDELKDYNASDVKLTIELFRKMNGVYFNL